jgi:Xaa-Pro aminopeptidase
MSDFKERLKKINHLKDRVDGILLFGNDPNFFYLTNSSDGIFFYDFSKPIIMLSKIDENKRDHIKKIEIEEKGFLDQLPSDCTIGINEKNLSVFMFRKIRTKFKTKNISKDLGEIRAVKTNYEISCIRRACLITKKIFSEIEDSVFRSTEVQLKCLIGSLISEHGVEQAFPPIIASNSNIVKPHHAPTRKRIKKPALIDLGVRYNGYCSDVTRTIGSSLENRIENILEELYPRIIPDVKAKDLELFVRKRLGIDKRFFTHSLGHGLGIEVHERPWISKKSKDVLKEGMVFTIEPGIYKKNGLRIENDFLLKKNSLENLTDF